MPNEKTIKQRLENIGWTRQQVTSAGLDILGVSKVLDEGETIEQAIRCTNNKTKGMLLATDRRLVFVNQGLIRMQSESFQYNKVSSVQIADGFMSAQLFLIIDSRTLTIEGIDKSMAGTFADYVRRRVNDGPMTQPTPPMHAAPSAAPQDIAGQLERLAALREKGILTDAEFQEQKRKLLAS